MWGQDVKIRLWKAASSVQKEALAKRESGDSIAGLA
jgi:hypothetical protein